MGKTTRTLTIALALALAGSGSAFAGALGGKEYRGGIPEKGVKTEGHIGPGSTHAYHGQVSLRVSRNGSTVRVSFTSPWPVLYCYTTKELQVQRSRSVRISRSGSFTASVEERFSPGPGLPPIMQT